MPQLPPFDDHVPDQWPATLESTRDATALIERTLIVAIVGPVALAVGAIIASPFAGVAARLFSWAAGL